MEEQLFNIARFIIESVQEKKDRKMLWAKYGEYYEISIKKVKAPENGSKISVVIVDEYAK